MILENPYPGLRPFDTDQSHLFFGRDEQIDNLLQRLGEEGFVSVVGASGTGKSSLVNAGLVPALHAGLLLKNDATRWNLVTLKPGRSPIRSLAMALSGDGAPDSLMPQTDMAAVEATLRRSAFGLVDAVHRATPTDRRTLVVVDQFEELFRFADSGHTSHDHAAAFVKLLIEGFRSKDDRLNIVLTMRSDFLDRCPDYHGLPEIIDETLLLVPRMRRDQLQVAIEGPAVVAGGRIAPRLVQRLLNDVSGPDSLPLLQHVLMRSWQLWQQGSNDEAGAAPEVGIELYEQAGTIDGALSRHAEEAFGELTDHQQALAVPMFKTLVHVGADFLPVRRPTSVEEMSQIVQAPQQQINEVLAHFEKDERNFLYRRAGEIIDVSHEAFFRQWERMSKWVSKETSNRESYQSLVAASARYGADKDGLLRGRALRVQTNWWNRCKPNEAWAERSVGDFTEVAQFLKRSRRVDGARVVMSGLAMVLLVAAGLYGVSRIRDTERLKQGADEELKVSQLANLEFERSLNEKEDALRQTAEQVDALTLQVQSGSELIASSSADLRNEINNVADATLRSSLISGINDIVEANDRLAGATDSIQEANGTFQQVVTLRGVLDLRDDGSGATITQILPQVVLLEPQCGSTTSLVFLEQLSPELTRPLRACVPAGTTWDVSVTGPRGAEISVEQRDGDADNTFEGSASLDTLLGKYRLEAISSDGDLIGAETELGVLTLPHVVAGENSAGENEVIVAGFPPGPTSFAVYAVDQLGDSTASIRVMRTTSVSLINGVVRLPVESENTGRVCVAPVSELAVNSPEVPVHACFGELGSSEATPTPRPSPGASLVKFSCQTEPSGSVLVGEAVLITTSHDQPESQIVIEIDHDDGFVDFAASSHAVFAAPGVYRIVARWQAGSQRGSAVCANLEVFNARCLVNEIETPDGQCEARVSFICSVTADASIQVNEQFLMYATFDPPSADIEIEFAHGDGTFEAGPTQDAFYLAPGSYTVSATWDTANQSGSAVCGVVTVVKR